MNKIQARNMLNDVVEHFSKDPNGLRCRKSTGTCTYRSLKEKPNSIGCAIGMYIKDDKLCKKMDKTGSIDQVLVNVSLKNQLPKFLLEMNVSFLEDIQNFHDFNQNFDYDNNCISFTGKRTINNIIEKYNLGKPYFKNV